MGVFSVAPDRKVAFSAGMLLYNTKTHIWSFSESVDPSDMDDYGDNVISAFAFGTGNAPQVDPTTYDENNGFHDWGENAIVNGGNKAGIWRTLEADEWKYLVNERPRAKELYGRVTLQEKDIQLLMLIPDNLNSQEIATIKKRMEVSEDEMTRLEEYGVIFLYYVNNENYDKTRYWFQAKDCFDQLCPCLISWPIDYVEGEDPEELHAVRLVRDL